MSNKGAQMMAKMGFTQGQGLGAAGTGMQAPVDAGAGNNLKLGVGVAKETWEPTAEDDAFALYRKKMMLGYKHRPNPLGNPRSTYY
jgi:splicing factor 4